ncbi:hypothetical protein SAMN05443637_109139 [Pseudonocardia thermophila]|uniref:DUF35 domain-containing protein n=1 Tax=Pseudonocardia thermophila TaxID=1848 RepID=A0A1M6U565_PSETH|nr:zinc ribbon domain-containing protein [Pseudonocardia thermophila]SHK64310.1 hypothetical protein SAMN05443637_109139 [Pseudonocardia thermophila]
MIVNTEFPLPGVPHPVSDFESAPFWQGLAGGKLLAPRCTRCERFHFPPLPACPHCGDSTLDWRELVSTPVVYSWIVVHRATRPEIPVPYTVVLAEFPEGIRIPGNMAGDASPLLRAGAPLKVSIASRDGLHVVVYDRA